MSTTTDILDLDLPEPTWAFRPSVGTPLRDDMSLSRSSGAWTRTPQGLYEYRSAGQPRIYGQDQSLLVEGPQLTNFIDHREVGSGGWSQEVGTPSQTTGKTGIDRTANAVEIGDDNTSALETWSYVHSIASDNGDGWTAKYYVKKDSDKSRFPRWHLSNNGGPQNIIIDTSDGSFVKFTNNGFATVNDAGDWWEVVLTVNNAGGGGSDTITTFVQPAYESTLQEGGDASATGSIIVDAPMLVRHPSVPTDAGGHADKAWNVAPIMLDDPSGYPAQVTKNSEKVTADVCDVFNPNEGAVLVEFDLVNLPADGNSYSYYINNGSVHWLELRPQENNGFPVTGEAKFGGTGNIKVNQVQRSTKALTSYKAGHNGRGTLSINGVSGEVTGDNESALGDADTLTLTQSYDIRWKQVVYFPEYIGPSKADILTS